MRRLSQTVLAIALVCLATSASQAAPAECKITPTSVRDLIRGAITQTISISTTECAELKDLKGGEAAKLTLNNVAIQGNIEKAPSGNHPFRLKLENISADLQLGQAIFDITVTQNSGQLNGKIALNVSEITLINSTVTYSDIEKSVTRSQQHRKTPPAPLGSGLPIAVANPILGSYYDDSITDESKKAILKRIWFQIVNHAYLTIPNTLNKTGAKWSIYAESPTAPTLQFIGEKQPETSIHDKDILPQEIAYIVSQQHDGRIRTKIEMKDGTDTLFSIVISLADSARPGVGQPVRISEMMSVVCRKPSAKVSDIARNGTTHAISRNLMSHGQCYLYIDPCNNRAFDVASVENPPKSTATGAGPPIEQNTSRLARALIADEAQKPETEENRLTAAVRLTYNLYGAQNLFVTVERQGVVGKWEGRWPVEPSSWVCRPWERKEQGKGTATVRTTLPRPSEEWKYQPVEVLQLRPPTADQGGGEETYQIHVQAAARSPLVEYAEGVVAPSGEGLQLLSPEYQFDARLRPSGLYGIPYARGGFWDGRSVRVFVTLPIEGVSLRFPTSVRDLRSTSDSTSVQVLTLRAGALLTIEPWDYNRGENFVPIPVRFQAGGHLIDLGSGTFTPSLLIGFSAALPLVQTSAKFAQTTVGLGAFYELDGRDGSSHALLTVGLNLLSLFSPPAGASQ